MVNEDVDIVVQYNANVDADVDGDPKVDTVADAVTLGRRRRSY